MSDFLSFFLIMMFKIYTRAIILNKKNQVLLLKKNNKQNLWAGKWMQPWGTLEFGEDPEITLVRELKEELDLDVCSFELYWTKTLLIDWVHWLGLYYLVGVANEQYTNMEPEKHEEVARIAQEQLPKMLHVDLIEQAMLRKKKKANLVSEVYTIPKLHTMWDALFGYIDIKMHHLLREKKRSHIKVIPLYDRKKDIGENEKIGKLFNRKRPTADAEENTLSLYCFPGVAYVKHYAALLHSYFMIHQFPLPLISYDIPNKELIIKSLQQTNLKYFPQQDTVILGMVEQLSPLLSDVEEWKWEWDFLWKMGKINGKSVALLWCKFSFWWDIAGHIVSLLAEKGVKKVIYVGKLGGLKDTFSPNQMLATGSESFVDWENISWENPFSQIKDEFVIQGKHYTSYSIIAEDNARLEKVYNDFDFVDPEIWYMAKAAKEKNIIFWYLHIISNVLTSHHTENLSNERTKSVKEKRKELFDKIIEYLRISL